MDLYNKLNLDKLLGSDCRMNYEQKKFFGALAEAFEKRQDEAFTKITKGTINALDENSKCCPVVTTITNGKYEEGFFPILSQEEHKNNIVFMRDKIENILETDEFECSDNKFQLVRTNIYVEKEKILANMFRIHNIRHPYCYSPFARRAFFINIWDKAKQKYVPYDYKRDDVHTIIYDEKENIVFGDLCWNIEQIDVGKKLRPKDIPSSDAKGFVRFEDCDENTYICTSVLNDAVRTERVGQNYIEISREDYENYKHKLTKIKIHDVDNIAKNRFSNIYDKTNITPTRAITKADIALIVKKFYPIPEEYKGVNGYITNNNTIKDYEYKYRYVYEDMSLITAKNKNYCYLCFEDSGFDEFFVDRVNFFISFIRYCYPNFYWVGVRK